MYIWGNTATQWPSQISAGISDIPQRYLKNGRQVKYVAYSEDNLKKEFFSYPHPLL